ncbi:cupin domain-containing protein [Pseudomonas syringae]|uniref:cupin domain-containing protein n=1 Tax=Pseudomonas TaxID=286 RepID=UPI000702BE13|nr:MULTISPECIES: cupin domain-containing protein [Pseudomonas]MBD8576522.1 cupin domain-containing protein [Pseudomonas syringae]KQQ49301.1 cupin [Pseudomonas sp. Leaf127]MBD8793166.1 cupin domain-containing protein [Pseudomonas syringae]MBD8803860.1 cupin domain-containing protein [Pseudomonas syringae]MBD8814427.1 cupin domain-containing protein [Pseudomonas syringae]
MARNLVEEAALLPDAWRSRILGTTGGANLKVIRMDANGIPYETHNEFDEALLLIDGQMSLEVEGEVIVMRAGDFHVVPAGKQHRVLKGSYGTLFLVDAQ